MELNTGDLIKTVLLFVPQGFLRQYDQMRGQLRRCLQWELDTKFAIEKPEELYSFIPQGFNEAELNLSTPYGDGQTKGRNALTALGNQCQFRKRSC